MTRSGVGKRFLDATLKQARVETAQRKAARRREENRTARQDPRPQVSEPLQDAEWLPVMRILNEAHAASTADEPPMRDSEGDLAQVRVNPPTGLHLLTADGSADAPAPPQPLISKLTDTEAAEMIERHVEFVVETADGHERSVHLGAPFVRHFMKRCDRALPVVNGISTLPLVLPNGELLTGQGLDRRSGIVFRIPPGLWLPQQSGCDDTAVARAISTYATSGCATSRRITPANARSLRSR